MIMRCFSVNTRPLGACSTDHRAKPSAKPSACTMRSLPAHDAAGCTVWFREKLHAPVTIRYRATVSARSRVSDLNCFWMASDPAHPGALVKNAAGRTGKFEDYDRLALYYVGYGGNENTTTRFRRYDGTGAKPLRPEHDLRDRRFLLEGDRSYTIEITMSADGRVRWARDGEVLFDFTDPQPLREGWFGFRTVHSRIEIADFQVTVPDAAPAAR
jgi:hypothetical protein